MKLVSWNVNGLRACVGKGFYDFVSEERPDILCLQETKLQEGQIQMELPGYEELWNYAEKKAIPVRHCSPEKSRQKCHMESVSRSMTEKGGLSRQNTKSSMW